MTSETLPNARHDGFGADSPLLASDQLLLARRSERGCLKSLAVTDRLATHSASLADVWRSLIEGRRRVVQAFFSELRCGVALETPRQRAPGLNGRRLQIIEQVLRGIGQKQIAIDLGLSPSTVASNARLALASIGIESKPSHVHPLPMLAAMAVYGDVAATSASSRHLDGLEVIEVPRPELSVAGQLPTAELHVIRSLVEGCCYAQIATRRGTAQRTTANQIAAVFRRLKVSGRSALIRRLFQLQASAETRAASVAKLVSGRASDDEAGEGHVACGAGRR